MQKVRKICNISLESASLFKETAQKPGFWPLNVCEYSERLQMQKENCVWLGAIFVFALLACSGRAEEAKVEGVEGGGARVVHFPKERSLGSLSIQDTESVDEIFLAQRQNFMRLKSISMIYSEDWEPSEYVKTHTDRPFFRYSSHLVFCFKKEDEKFRIEHALDGTKVHPGQEDSVIYSIVAFNLDRYQRFEKRIQHLFLQSQEINPLEETNLPLIIIYRKLFAFSGKRLTFETIKDKSVWDELKQQTIITGNTTVDSHDCVKTDISFPGKMGKMYSCQIYWAKELGYYPVKFQLFNLDGKKLIEITVKKVIKRDTVEGPIFIPMITEHTEWHGTGGHKVWTLKHSIDSDSLSINEDIPDEVFTIPLDMANRISDNTNSWNNYDPKYPPIYSMKGKALPDFTLAKPGGGNVTLSREKAKVIVLDFWTTWCGSCIAALPGLERVQKWAIENELPVAFYCINVKEEAKKIEKVWKKHKMSIPVLMDKNGVVREKYNVPGFPTMIIVADGMIKHVHIGGGGDKKMLLRQEKQLKEEIKVLLAKNRSK